jgi:hypothetical protein
MTCNHALCPKVSSFARAGHAVEAGSFLCTYVNIRTQKTVQSVSRETLCTYNFSTVLISKLLHRYQQAIERYGAHGFAIFSITAGFGHLRFL